MRLTLPCDSSFFWRSEGMPCALSGKHQTLDSGLLYIPRKALCSCRWTVSAARAIAAAISRCTSGDGAAAAAVGRNGAVGVIFRSPFDIGALTLGAAAAGPACVQIRRRCQGKIRRALDLSAAVERLVPSAVFKPQQLRKECFLLCARSIRSTWKMTLLATFERSGNKCHVAGARKRNRRAHAWRAWRACSS